MRPLLFLAILLLLLVTPWGSAMPADEAFFGLATGSVSPGEALMAQLVQGSAAAQLPRAPGIIYRDATPTCDVDGDGERDLLVNNLTLVRAPSHSGAASELQAVSGRDGSLLWKVDNLFAVRMPTPSAVPYYARGQSFPTEDATALPALDLDGDGACDILAVGGEGLAGFSAPFVGQPSISDSISSVRALSGRDGSELWRVDFQATATSANEPLFGFAENEVYRGYLSGVLPFDTAGGPRLLTKTTDMRYERQAVPLGLPIPSVDPNKPILKGAPETEDIRVTDRIQLRDATTGDLLWERVLGSESPSSEIDARYTNVTWLAGIANLNGDETPDVLLDQMVITTPRTTEANHPVTGETLFRYGRGVRVTTLDGASGATLWNAVLLDPLAAEANVETEESRETLAWTRTTALGDIDGDGLDDVMSSWVAREESLVSTLAGSFRTHFAPLSGADGASFWDVRQQGWGIARALDASGPVRRLGIGMLDVPAVAEGDSMFPPKFVRLLGVDAQTGKTLWSDERSFAQNSFVSYNLALSQFETTLAPFDWDGDGLLDMVSAAQPSARNGRDQVLMATASHTYDVRAGSDGRVLGTVTAWGSDGRVVACPGAEARLTILSGHARRIEVARFDPISGERQWRSVLHNDPAPRAATTAMDMTALGGACADLPGAGTLLGVDLQAYSFERRHEVVPVLASLDADGGARWISPSVQGSPPSDALFQASIDDAPPSTRAIVGSALGAFAVGGLLGFAVLAILARRGSALLAAGIVLLLLAPGAIGLATPPALLTAASADGTTTAYSNKMDSARNALAPRESAAMEPVMARFADKDTVSFPYEVGDVDGDGFEDLVLDQYCRSGEACGSAIYIPDDMTSFVTGFTCDYLHDLTGVSGVNGTPTWSIDITVRGPFGSCGASYVFGTFDTNQGRAILVYSLIAHHPVLFGNEAIIFHNVTAYLARDGAKLWERSAVGTFNSDLAASVVARDYHLLPIVRDGAIFLQSVGWISSSADSFFPIVPGYTLTDRPLAVHNVHKPIEWLARLDPETGADLWRVDSFQPVPEKNVLPRALRSEYLDSLRYSGYFFLQETWWDTGPCCGDVTGDGVPDVTFEVLEWGNAPNARAVGPEALDVRVVVFDGASGAIHRDLLLGEGLPLQRVAFGDRYYGLGAGEPASPIRLEPAGDVDGDGAQDILAHVYIRAPEWRQDMMMISGASGEVLWTESSIRDLRALVLGDADGDGGDDFLLLDWYGHEGTPAKDDDFVTPRENPLSMRSGRTGAELWRAMTYAAPADILESFRAILRNGVVDIDADGVGDFFADDPLYLDDQTVVHQISFLSGSDGRALRTVRTVGAFGIPAGAGDLDEDGRGEVAILTGDVSDMWLTVYDGASGEPEWSRRVASLPSSGFTQALPQFRIQQLGQPTEDAFVLTFHMQITQTYTYLGFCIGTGCGESTESGERIGQFRTLVPQMLHLDGADGALQWALPALTDADVLARTLDATPGALAFEDVYARASASGLASLAAREARPFAIPVVGSFLVGLALVLGGGIALVRYQRRFEGVPSIDR